MKLLRILPGMCLLGLYHLSQQSSKACSAYILENVFDMSAFRAGSLRTAGHPSALAAFSVQTAPLCSMVQQYIPASEVIAVHTTTTNCVAVSRHTGTRDASAHYGSSAWLAALLPPTFSQGPVEG